MIPRGNHATDMIEAADRNYEWQERREWEKAHLPPAGDGVKDGKTDDNAPLHVPTGSAKRGQEVT